MKGMNENRTQDGQPKPQAVERHPEEWQRDLNPDHLAGQNIGVPSERETPADRTAFNLRKQGWELAGLDDNELKQIPVLAPGTRLQQGGTYVDLMVTPLVEFTATGDTSADERHAFAPKDRVPYEIWNRLLGEEKPGQQGRRV
jgi:hypothetical protein